jgi:uncharacterized protein YndB with AHSA1/START domain
MAMTKSKGAPEQDAVTCEIEIAAPPERVFAALTDPKQLFSWWGKEPSVVLSVFEMDARPGGRWRFRCKPAPGAQHGEVGEQVKQSGEQVFEAHGEILEYVPPRLLVWSWLANWHEHPDSPTVVRWDLKSTPKGTLVRVTHSALAQEPVSREGYGAGWQGVLQLLNNHFQA